MKKRILSLILALSMVLSVLPLGAFAAGSTNGKELVMKNGMPDLTGLTELQEGQYIGDNWGYDRNTGTLTLLYGTFDFSSTHPQGKTQGTPTTTPVACAIKIESGVTITGGTFNATVDNGTWNRPGGTISNGIFNGGVTNSNTIKKGTFNGQVTNEGTIDKGTFNGDVENSGTINNGTFAANKEVTNYGTIENGTFAGNVRNERTIENGTFKDSVINLGTITDGIFEENVQNDNEGTISGGAFSSTVENYGGTISGGTFAAGLSWNNGSVTGGVFNGDKVLTGVTGLHSITVASGAKITEVNDVFAVWDPYVVVTKSTPTTAKEVTITASTEIYSLNGQPIGDGNCKSSYPDTSKKTTVKFTMPDDKDVVLGTGDLVMAGGYPVGSNGGTANCEGKGWTYSEKDISNLTGKLTLTSGTFDFSLANPQDTTKTTSADSAVACAVVTQSGVEITGGTFHETVTNSGTIERGTFAGGVTNSGTIKNGTFACSVTNYSNIESKGTFNGTVENHGGTISSGTFKGTVQNWYGTISGGTFHEKVSNSNGEITGGTFAAGLSANHNTVTGGVFNGKTGLTDALHVTVTNGSVDKVNGVVTTGTAWDLYSYAGTTVIVTASTEIFSLNDQPIGGGIYNSSYPNTNDKTTVKFTMPGDNVVLNRTAELKVVGGEIKSGETAKGSGRVLIGGKVEVTTKDKTQDFVGWTIAPEGIELRDDDGREVDLTSEWTFSFMMPDVSGGKLTLTANYQPFRTSLLMNADGTVNLEHVNHETYDGNETCKGDGWNVFNRGTLILEKWTYDFQYTAPTEKTGTLEAVTCGVQNKGGTIENGVFRNIVLNEVGGTITGGTFATGLIEVPGMTGGSVTGGVFNGKTGLTDAHHVTVTDGSLLKVNGEDPLNADETTGTVTPGTA